MTIAIMAAATVTRLIASGRTISLPIVAATAVPDIAPRKLNTAAMRIALVGLRTRVEMTVAMAFGASVQPLTNSAASTSTSTNSSPMVSSPITLSLNGHTNEEDGLFRTALFWVPGEILRKVTSSRKLIL